MKKTLKHILTGFLWVLSVSMVVIFAVFLKTSMITSIIALICGVFLNPFIHSKMKLTNIVLVPFNCLLLLTLILSIPSSFRRDDALTAQVPETVPGIEEDEVITETEIPLPEPDAVLPDTQRDGDSPDTGEIDADLSDGEDAGNEEDPASEDGEVSELSAGRRDAAASPDQPADSGDAAEETPETAAGTLSISDSEKEALKEKAKSLPDSYYYEVNINPNERTIHMPNCRLVKDISEEDYAKWEQSLENLIDMGYTFCDICMK